MKRSIYTISLLILSIPAFAEEKAAERLGSGNIYQDLLFISLASLIFLLLLVSLVLLKAFKGISKELLNPTPLVNEPVKVLEFEEWLALKNSAPSIWNKLLGLKPISEEKELLLEHKFDDISELDNPTPAWFMWLFYASIAIGAAYLFTYHGGGGGKLQEEEYAIEMEEAVAEKAAYLANAANLIDENTVEESKEASVITSGQAIFNSNCIACHGDKGQGVVGPNLTDEYWLHGGKINNVFKTIKYGIPDKGMISWEKTLSPKQISEVANYIKSLKGTNPANPKAPQGEKEG